ncbi:hypothetical protein LSCM1_02861 [Leishmania martiniquensis]|uniref:C3H1-type domain-containing protein n=1 Tax=Leishmania martiniquensis TaxID=1580590 RepID=A0A836GTZ0_9TRYP|nr:hypothetical protein LSCM1_02861 [Leishmania martiniquensis]
MSTHSSTSSRPKKVRCKKWDTIQIPFIDDLEALTEREIQNIPLPSGFCVRFLCHDMEHLFTVASAHVRITRGTLDYLHDYNQLGPNKSRSKLFVCSHYNKMKECMNGHLCREVHCVLNVEDAQDALPYQVPSNATGAPNLVMLAPAEEIIARRLNEPLASGNSTSVVSTVEDSNPLDSIIGGGSASDGTTSFYMPDQLILRHTLHTRWTSTKMYPTLPSGVEFRVALPNTPTPVDTYDSSALFVTRGAQEYFNLYMRNEQPTVTMQHCAHYSKNGICCFGEDCQFVHVVHFKFRDRAENAVSDADPSSMGSSGTNSESSRPRAGRRISATTHETPLNASAPGKKKGDSKVSSRSSSSHRDSSTPQSKAIQKPSSSGLSAPGSHVFVPPTSPWNTVGAVPSSTSAPQSLPPPQLQHFTQDSMILPAIPSQSSPLLSHSYLLMQGLNGHCYILPQSTTSMPPPPQPTPSQPLYVMSMPFR